MVWRRRDALYTLPSRAKKTHHYFRCLGLLFDIRSTTRHRGSVKIFEDLVEKEACTAHILTLTEKPAARVTRGMNSLPRWSAIFEKETWNSCRVG